MLLLEPFIDSKQEKINYRNSLSTSGSNLSAINQYRQGIEITENTFHLGTIKIYSGYPNHFLPQNTIGQNEIKITDEIQYIDVDSFNTTTFLNIQHSTTSSTIYTFNGTYPNKFDGKKLFIDNSLDKILEPLSIRNPNYKLSINYKINATIINGNEYKNNINDFVSEKYEFQLNNNKFMFDDISTSENNDVIQKSILKKELNSITPWKDSIIPFGNYVSSNMDEDLQFKLLSLESIQNDYISLKYKSTPNGFVYDTQVGVDSIAFGGFTYFSCSVSLPPE